MSRDFANLSPAYPGRAPWGTASSLRAWQAAALEQYLTDGPRDFLAVATPGAGKTTFALRVARELLDARIITKITVVTPTEHLKVQWADAAHRAGIALDPGLGGSRRGRSREFAGTAVTYAGVAARHFHYRAVTENSNMLVILDEIHHAGDARTWGEAVAECFAPARRRLALTGTPFRSDDNPIPFVRYEELADGSRRSAADYTYGYAEALRDHVVRPVLFMAYGGPMRWRTKAGDELEAQLAEPMTKDLTAHAWRTALDPKGEWIQAVLRAADVRLTETRRHVPDAGGLVIATDQAQARAYARVLAEVSGEKPTVVLSDDTGSSRKIEEFAESESRWLVAVRMVSEGVDVPRLAVGVYATATSTPLFFAQAIGRFVRARRRGEVATVFVPTVAPLLANAAALERERDHVIGARAGEKISEEELLARANREDSAADDLLGEWEALDSQAHFDHVLFDAHQFGLQAAAGTQDELDYLGLPGLLEPDQVREVLHDRQRRHAARQSRRERREKVTPEVSLHRALEAQRKLLNSLVSQLAHTRGVPHSHVHAELRRKTGGPPLSRATTEQVEARIVLIRRWHADSRA
ncbi:MAG TPA: DEAD/DEAH box helicase [Tetrasphaera sp.]|uniref:DEAD/DEAH box helicase n=1 Tax=Nostocoides sp. TaxID=1917966 RepID=UPI002BC0ADDC|nr:DEAD/DEAH box helicase [Tetrasphaera sp.]HNQ07192.1 DEAD/DEAH box helicase [Tetrasphaera sp.]